MTEEKKEKKIDANSIVSPKNTRKLYGNKNLEGEESRPGDAETIETSLPQDFDGVDQEVGHTMYPSKSSRDPHDPVDL
jgi:hypothetical protein